MDAIDTNVLVRYLIGDHPEQLRKAHAAIRSRAIFVSITVLLESEWVLRSLYGQSILEICRGLRAFAGLPQVTVENPALLADALERTEAGMDFADALHLGAASHCDTLLSFDRKFIRAAAGNATPVKEPD